MADYIAVRDAVSRLLHDPRFTPARVLRVFRREAEAQVSLPVDVYTTAEDIVVIAAVPGVKPRDLEIKIEGDCLTLRGKYPPPVVNVLYAMQECPTGYFSRTLRLNVPVDAGRAQAKIVDGQLIVVLPKIQETQSKVVHVRVQA
ncbi:MAG TPA: Hsp20/alpha crystallin family protein [Anaerolineae bacterium]|nr:Hsp20/alpha crystallin family protein [Anaerolineae bacterium]HQI86691.1 Hsp20/alpha crystallin family protein [Anaerolineae bacterium]HQK13419.1 Hsp20/alpha crystallin family protein [Anaerolineae bacterium]